MDITEIKMLIWDCKYDISRIEKTLTIFYPNWTEWMSNNHIRTYEKLTKRLQDNQERLSSLEEQLEILQNN